MPLKLTQNTTTQQVKSVRACPWTNESFFVELSSFLVAQLILFKHLRAISYNPNHDGDKRNRIFFCPKANTDLLSNAFEISVANKLYQHSDHAK